MKKRRGGASEASLLASEIDSHRRSQKKRTMDPLLMHRYPVSKMQKGRVLKLGVDHPPLRNAEKIGNTFGPGPKLKGAGC